MARLLWNDAAGRAHSLSLGNAPPPIGDHACTSLCASNLARQRHACILESAVLQLTVRMKVADVLLADADGCEVAVLRRSDVTEPEATLAVDAFYLLVLRSCYATSVPPHIAWGIGPDAIVSCLRPEDMHVADLFPLSLGRRQAMRELVHVVAERQREARLLTAEEVEGVFGDSWLDVERVDAQAMPARCDRCSETRLTLGTNGSCRRCSSRDDPSGARLGALDLY